MPLSIENRHFELGNFNGFNTYGLCRVAESFRTIRGAHTIGPVRGHCFAVLDAPEQIDSEGARLECATSPADTGYLVIEKDHNGNFTLGGDGAILECTDVTIDRGQSLWFHWAFARFDWSPFNDFAVFEAYEGSDVDTAPLYRIVLQQSLELETSHRWYTDWRAHAWRPNKRFNGTLRWVVSNGLSTSLPTPSPGVNARPSALLLDGIDIT